MSERDVIVSAAEPVKVNIFNQSYSLRARDGGEHALRVARVVDERMRQIAAGLSVCDVTKIAVLAAMHLADELEGMRDHYERELDSLRTAQPAPSPDPEREEHTPGRDPVASSSSDTPAARSWFEAIFDDEAFDRPGAERMSNHIPSRLKRPRQPRPDAPAPTDAPARTDPFEP